MQFHLNPCAVAPMARYSLIPCPFPSLFLPTAPPPVPCDPPRPAPPPPDHHLPYHSVQRLSIASFSNFLLPFPPPPQALRHAEKASTAVVCEHGINRCKICFPHKPESHKIHDHDLKAQRQQQEGEQDDQ